MPSLTRRSTAFHAEISCVASVLSSARHGQAIRKNLLADNAVIEAGISAQGSGAMPDREKHEVELARDLPVGSRTGVDCDARQRKKLQSQCALATGSNKGLALWCSTRSCISSFMRSASGTIQHLAGLKEPKVMSPSLGTYYDVDRALGKRWSFMIVQSILPNARDI